MGFRKTLEKTGCGIHGAQFYYCGTGGPQVSERCLKKQLWDMWTTGYRKPLKNIKVGQVDHGFQKDT